MRTVRQNNKILKNFNHKIFVFPTEMNQIFSIVKVSGEGNYFERLLGTDVVDTVFTSTDYNKVCKHVNEIIKSYGSGLVGAK
ncbi:hypothetical protein ACSFBI_05305 [Variovorax sp. RB3P1]